MEKKSSEFQDKVENTENTNSRSVLYFTKRKNYAREEKSDAR